MKETTKRAIFRWLHLIFAIPIIGYVYSPFQELPNYAPVVRYVAFSGDRSFGIVDVERPLGPKTCLKNREEMKPTKPISVKTSLRSRKPTKARTKSNTGEGSRLIDKRIKYLDDWRGETLAQIRRLIHEADPNIVEECKWVKPTNPMGVPVWSHAGIVCTGETYKEVVKVTFARGASLDDSRGLFNASLEGNMRRAIDIREGEKLDARAFKALVKAAVAENLGTKASKSSGKSSRKMKTSTEAKQAKLQKNERGVVLLSGGNPQIAKGDGDAPVQAYIAAMPGWKSKIGKRLDTLITRSVPKVRKAVKWNSPFYGLEGQGWFLSFHVFTRYVKVGFFAGSSLQPIPPGASKDKNMRYLDIYEDDKLDEAQFASWVRQAAALPGWIP